MNARTWVIIGSAGGGVTVWHIDTDQGMTYSAAQKLADEINSLYAIYSENHPGICRICRKPANTHIRYGHKYQPI